MTALSIQPTYPIFTDIDGQPLEDGFVWVGSANLDPQTNPIAVFWDAALTLPAVQPVRTLAGYPANSGTPARLYVNSDYSIRVMNKKGSVVYSAPATTERYSDAVVGGVNASKLTYDPAGVGAVSTTVQAKLRESVSITDKGASTASADNTTAIQTALNESGAISFPDGEFITGPLTLSSNTTLIFSPGTVLRAKPGFTQFQRLLSGSGISNVTIFGNHGTIQMLKAEYVSGEDRHGLALFGSCSNISIYDLTVKDAGGDGFYVNGDNIALVNCVSDNARRNGLSIIQGRTINIIGGEYKNSTGAAPMFGIDIEPNNAAEYLQGINLIGVKTSGNARGGLSIVTINSTNDVSINVSNYTSIGDAALGTSGGVAGILFALEHSVKTNGYVNIENATIQSPGNHGVYFLDWTTNNPVATLRNVNVLNPGTIASGSNSFNNGFYTGSGGAKAAPAGNIRLIDCSAKDLRAVPLMRIGAFIQTLFTNNTSDVSISGFEAFGWSSTYTTGIVFGSSNSVDATDISYRTTPVIAPAATSFLDRALWGAQITNGAQSSHTVNLPASTGNKGYTIEFRLVQDGFIRVIPAAGDTILRYAGDPTISIAGRKKGDYIKLVSLGDTNWQAVAVTGEWLAFIGSSLFNTSYRISCGKATGAPTTGTWVQGDIVYHSAPAASGFIGWVCTVAGTPGTWKTFGAISA